MFATVITDASFCHKTKAAGWAAWIVSDSGRILKSGNFKRRPETPFQAEYWASCNGIHLAALNGATSVLLQTDCKGVIDAISKNKGVIAKIRELHPSLQIKTRHVKGHTSAKNPKTKGSRYHVNRWCDEMARTEMRKQRQI